MGSRQVASCHRNVVADAIKGIKAVWLISVPVFLNGQAEKVTGPDRVGAPHAVYKVVGWQKTDGKFMARGYIIRQVDSGSDLTAFLESIDTIEAETGLDFFADLDDEVQEELERRLVRLCGVTSDRRPLASDVRRTEARLLDRPSIGKSLPRRR